MDISIKHLYGQTSAVWTAPYLLQSWVKDYCRQGSHVNLFQQQADNLENSILEIFGGKRGELFGKFDQGGFVLKTSQPYLMEIETSNNQPMPSLFLENLPKWGWITGSDMELWGQKTPMLHTNGKDSGSWPTPRASDIEGGVIKNVEFKNGSFSRRNADGTRWGVKLRDAVESRLWPTPRAIYGEHPGMTDPNHLTGAVKMWGTPRTSDYKGSGPYGSKSFHHMLDRSYLCAQVIDPDIKGNLSPDWTEWLMGVPAGWTKLEPMAEGAFENWKRRMMDGTWWNDEHDLPRITPNDDKLKKKDRAKRVKALGNGIVPRVIPVFLHHLKGTKNGHI